MKVSLFLVILCLPVINSPAANRPNILYLFTDDQSHRTIGCYPESYAWVRTPHIDRLANEGVRFSHVYMAPFCVASRITAMTGNLPHAAQGKFGAETLQGVALEKEIKKHPFWVQRLRASGYYTGQIGKWHIYSRMPALGIDWDFSVYWHKKIVNQYYNDQKVIWNGESRELGGYSTDRYTDIALKFIEKRANAPKQPWYLWLCYAGVHMPQTAADRHQNELQHLKDEAIPLPIDLTPPYPDKPTFVQQINYYGRQDGPKKFREHVKRYHRAVMSIDESVGRLYSALKQTGQLENTVVVFASDQGLAMGQHGLHRRKNLPYDATLRSPLIFRYPKRFAKRAVSSEPVNGADVIQTFHELSGLNARATMDGMSLVPLLTQPDRSLPRPVMKMSNVRTYFGESIPKGIRHYQQVAKRRHIKGESAQPPYMMIHDRRYKYVRYALPKSEGVIEELYDMKSDPEESVNLAVYPECRTLLIRMRTQTHQSFRKTQSGFSGGHFVDLFPRIK